MEKLILLPVIAVFLMRTAGYGVYTARERNITGAAGIFVLTLIAGAASAYFLFK